MSRLPLALAALLGACAIPEVPHPDGPTVHLYEVFLDAAEPLDGMSSAQLRCMARDLSAHLGLGWLASLVRRGADEALLLEAAPAFLNAVVGCRALGTVLLTNVEHDDLPFSQGTIACLDEALFEARDALLERQEEFGTGEALGDADMDWIRELAGSCMTDEEVETYLGH
ncbi:MAG: hypothetical protein H6732_06875 [Alphaproteobacteria bacterium]|nr:hypothetical protein [Alphaproteobacteria bacterium]